MGVTKTIAVVGASEETTAHLRLLMKLGAKQLLHGWRWGAEDAADFVAVEVHDLGAAGVIARCQSAGVPCAVLAEADETVVHGLVLRRPFKLDQIVAVLNAAGAATADTGAVESFSDDFYFREMEGDFATAAAPQEDIWGSRERDAPTPRAAPREDEHRSGLDYLIRGDPLVEPEAPKPLIQADTTVARGSSEPSRRAEARAEQNRHRVPVGMAGVETVDVAPIMVPRNEGLSSGETSGPRLLDWLDGDLLRSPSQLQLPECPALTLDPKQRVFHSEADLADLVPYCVEPLPGYMATSTSTVDLARLREAQPGRPYDDLRWLDALLKSSGRLAGRLDPGGTYQVRQPVTVNPDFQTHGAIATALAQPLRLHEVAAQSGAGMDRVFDVVNAYDAIGRLTWTPRQRRNESEASQDKPAGVLSRLKWPFGKR
jgi:hypothetical protein